MYNIAYRILKDKKLYRFRSINPNRPELVSRIFTHNELYFSSTRDLNDPWESKPHIYVGNLSDPEYKKIYIETFRNWMINNDPSKDPKDVTKWLESHSQEKANDLVTQIMQDYHNSLLNQRLCCFSSSCLHPLLWSHYSNSHRGFCLIFDASTEEFGSALKVKYQSNYPSLEITDSDPSRNLHVIVLTKAEFWSYEDEFRLIGVDSEGREYLPIKNNTFVFPENLLVGVIFGCQMTNEHKQLIYDWSSNRKNKLAFKQAIQSSIDFSLVIKDM